MREKYDRRMHQPKFDKTLFLKHLRNLTKCHTFLCTLPQMHTFHCVRQNSTPFFDTLIKHHFLFFKSLFKLKPTCHDFLDQITPANLDRSIHLLISNEPQEQTE